MASLFARARRYESLAPVERALLRLVEGLAGVALVGALTAAAQYLGSPASSGLGAVAWADVARVCAAGAAVAVLLAISKYFKAHGDPALAEALSGLGTRLAAGDVAPAPAQLERGEQSGGGEGASSPAGEAGAMAQ